MECFLCHENPSNGENLETHIKSDHGVKHDVDLLLALQVMTKEEKCSLLKQMEGRVFKVNQNVAKNEKYDVLEEMSSREEPVLKVINKVLKVEDNPKPVFSKRVDDSVATKIRFWKGKEASPKQAVKEVDGQSFFRRDGASNEKALNKFLKQTLSEHLLGQKSADDTIEIFDEIFATTCSPDLDDSVEGTFRLLLDDDLCEEAGRTTPSGNCSSSEEEVPEDLVAVPRRKRVLQETSKSVVITDGKYKCSECGKSFKFLTYLKGHMNSKVACNLKKKQGPLYIR